MRRAAMRAGIDELANRYQGASPGERAYLRDQIAVEGRHFVAYLVKNFASHDAPLEDLIQVGIVAMVKVLDDYDPHHGAKFSTFAGQHVVGTVKHYMRDYSWLLSAPRRLRNLAYRVRQQIGAIHTSVAPEQVTALAVDLGATAAEVHEAMAYLAALPTSMDILLDPHGNEAWGDMIPSLDPNLEGVPLRVTLQDALARLAVVDPKLAFVVRARFFEEWPQVAVGRALGKSQMEACRLQKRALAWLRQCLGEEELSW